MQSVEVDLTHWRIDHVEEYVEQRRAAQVVRQGKLSDQHLERHVLMLIGIERHAPDTIEAGDEIGIAGEVGT